MRGHGVGRSGTGLLHRRAPRSAARCGLPPFGARSAAFDGPVTTIGVEPIRRTAIPPGMVDPEQAPGEASQPLLLLDPIDASSLEAPDLIEPLTAFRIWRAIDGRLRSPYAPTFWDERVLPARCQPTSSDRPAHLHAHEPPHAECGCGIYAYHEPELHFPTVDYQGVTGIVTLWGRVEVEPAGMRAEFARVEALGTYSRWSTRQKRAVSAIAGRLGVDLLDLGDLQSAGERYGRRLLPHSRMFEPAHDSLSLAAPPGYPAEEHVAVAG
jgi:hypothetical protein